MRVRSIVAAGLAIFLAAVSSWASACDLSCSLQRVAGACDRAGKDESSSTSPKMGSEVGMSEHCRHAMQAEKAKTGPSAEGNADGMEWMSQTMHGDKPCDRNSISATAADEGDRFEINLLGAAPFIVATVVTIGEGAVLAGAEKRWAPPPGSTAVNPLSIRLRI